MPTSTIALFLFSVFASGAILAFAFRMRTFYEHPSLDSYFYFIMTTVCYGFANWIGPLFLGHFSKLAPQQETTVAIVVFVACAVPLAIIRLYFFVSTLFAVLAQKSPLLVTRAFQIGSIIVVGASIILFTKDLRSASLASTKTAVMLFGILIFVVDYYAIGYFLTQAGTIENIEQRKSASGFGWTYLAGFLAYSLPYYLSYWVHFPKLLDAVPYAYYLMHFLPMVFLLQFCRSQQIHSEEQFRGAPSLDYVVSKFAISIRERGVLELLLAGKNNKEIADELFISPNTVRNHIYSIYGKMAVKNRVQLVAVCNGSRFQRGATN